MSVFTILTQTEQRLFFFYQHIRQDFVMEVVETTFINAVYFSFRIKRINLQFETSSSSKLYKEFSSYTTEILVLRHQYTDKEVNDLFKTNRSLL
jgi:hypothetical protein